jgi:hypothetical protein
MDTSPPSVLSYIETQGGADNFLKTIQERTNIGNKGASANQSSETSQAAGTQAEIPQIDHAKVDEMLLKL